MGRGLGDRAGREDPGGSGGSGGSGGFGPHFVANPGLASAIVDPVREVFPGRIVHVRPAPLGIPVTVTAELTVPGTNSAG